VAAAGGDLDAARATLLAELREHALVIGEVTLSSGRQASYYVDARRALLRPAGFRAAGELIAAAAVAVVDRLAGGGDAIADAAGGSYRTLVTIDEIYPDRPDRDHI
jgi:orotate phosphoribosyltransferase